LLINEGIIWPLNADGKPTESHYRIELPRSNKAIGHYLSKYMSKAYALPRIYGYISGHSKLLDECTDIKIIESDIPFDELERIMNGHKVIHGSYMSHICVDLLRVKKIAPKIGALFESQYLQFVEILTLLKNSTIVKNIKQNHINNISYLGFIHTNSFMVYVG